MASDNPILFNLVCILLFLGISAVFRVFLIPLNTELLTGSYDAVTGICKKPWPSIVFMPSNNFSNRSGSDSFSFCQALLAKSVFGVEVKASK